VRSLRANTAETWDDGTLTLAGSAVRVAQYQWMLRVPAIGEASHLVLDPGRIHQIRDNNTGGLLAVGVLGGVPEDKAWYGDIDAFGNLGARQTYLSDGEGSLHSLAPLDQGFTLAGELTAADGRQRGWLVKADAEGRDEWKRQYGDAAKQELLWLANAGGVLVAAGYQHDETDDAWVIAVDATGELLLDKRFSEPGWTRLHTGSLLPDGDLLAVGLRHETQNGALDGAASLWSVRLGPDGEIRWDRSERSDLSLLTKAVRWGDGIAIAGLVGPVGTERRAVFAHIAQSGATTWTELDLPISPDWLQLSVTGAVLGLVATKTDELGVLWTHKPVELPQPK
jgi:hypothetical protein